LRVVELRARGVARISPSTASDGNRHFDLLRLNGSNQSEPARYPAEVSVSKWPSPGVRVRQLFGGPPRPSGLGQGDPNREDLQPTQRRRWQFSGRATGTVWKPTLADVVEKSVLGDCSRSRLATSDRYLVEGEWLHPNAANWRCRPIAAAQLERMPA
jgi:hypothetical protein